MDSTFFHYIARVERMVKKWVLRAVFSSFLWSGTKGNILEKRFRRFRHEAGSQDGYFELF